MSYTLYTDVVTFMGKPVCVCVCVCVCVLSFVEWKRLYAYFCTINLFIYAVFLVIYLSMCLFICLCLVYMLERATRSP